MPGLCGRSEQRYRCALLLICKLESLSFPGSVQIGRASKLAIASVTGRSFSAELKLQTPYSQLSPFLSIGHNTLHPQPYFLGQRSSKSGSTLETIVIFEYHDPLGFARPVQLNRPTI
jgi:hypothetical protein